MATPRDVDRQTVYRAENKIAVYDKPTLHTPVPFSFVDPYPTLDDPDLAAAREAGATYAEQRWALESRRGSWRTEAARRLRVVVSAVVATDEWDRLVRVPVEVSARLSTSKTGTSRGGIYTHGYGISMAATPSALSGPIVAHELAHVLVHRHSNGWGLPRAEPGHGPVWRVCTLRITALLCGSSFARHLDESFNDAELWMPRQAIADEWWGPMPERSYGGMIAELHDTLNASRAVAQEVLL